jgi:hypothetical protein
MIPKEASIRAPGGAPTTSTTKVLLLALNIPGTTPKALKKNTVWSKFFDLHIDKPRQ